GRTLRHVAGGLTEDLIDQLGQVEALRVISASGVAAYRERSVPLDSIARTLGVGTIVTGSVGRSADRLRVAVRLIDAANGNQLRSQTLERPWGDLFVLRDAVAQQVSRFLREELGQEVQLRQRRAATGSVAAWELVQRAQRQWDDARALRLSGDAVGAAERDLRAAAVPANPSQGRAWSALSQLLQARGKVAEANLAAERAYRADAFLRDAAEIVYRLYYTSSDLDRQADALRWCSE